MKPEIARANKFQNKLNESRNSRIEALNNNQNQLYDMFFKVIGVPNVLVILAISNIPIRTIIHSVFYLKSFYLITIYSYLFALVFYMCSFHFGNRWFQQQIKATDIQSHKLQSIIDKDGELSEDFQKEMNEQIKSTHYIDKLTQIIKNLVRAAYIINVTSFIIFVIILINCLV